MNISFNLPEINRKETRDRVEAALEKYKIMLLMDPEELEPKITSTFHLAKSSSNEKHSKTEDTAIKKINIEMDRENYIKKIIKAVNRLSFLERKIIIKRYLTDEDVYDYEVYNELGLSESKFYRIKSDAFYKLAFLLNIVVYKEGE